VFSCNYNGWADVPEEEREAIETFEVAQPAATGTPVLPIPLLIRVPASTIRSLPERKAA
jgi:hypothetical protein